ncbi:type II secretion system F family protein [Desulfurivibrio alkaliphilus]|uniref:Type II secretion system F domain protein n=1 Tax=Desulfurivibrio alkaliphilus (strain DSM 19089 / UNIQEM U267 / AHT2) TaxID=589865 RepID=D6Z766_DESAT|nr:type II secretion system F family protein [Desulfurivibrio alkaliphilus]ADH87053.1 Type II secretion system F domain protein [Desulfurivibrio alkaliphilus AHT 2]
MAKFDYQATTESGRRLAGTIEAASPDEATELLWAQGMAPEKVTRAKESDTSSLLDLLLAGKPVKPQDVVLFTKQLRTLLKAGVAITRSLEILQDQSEHPQIKRSLERMVTDIEEGATLEAAFRRHPKIFSKLYCSMIRAGEASGSLPEVLDRLSYILEHENKVKNDINTALAYPKIVSLALLGAFLFLLTMVIPQFVSTFDRAGIELPLPTVLSIAMYRLLTEHWLVLLVVLAAGFFGLRAYFNSAAGYVVKGHLLLRLPIVGPLFLRSAMSRFSSIFAILLASGVTVMESLAIISEVIGNGAISREFEKLKAKIEEGRGIGGPLRQARYFPPLVINMVEIGEESGSLDEMLQAVANHYDSEVEYAVKRLSDALGPILVVGLAAVVGFFALAIFMPMWDLTQMV